MWQSRAILVALVKRDLKSRYRTSVMGFAWAFAKPLMQLTVYAFVIGTVLGASRSIENFAIFTFVGLMFWNFFAETVTTGTFSILAGAGLVTKVSFPKEILPITSVVIATVNLLIQIPVLLLGYLIIGSEPNYSQFIFLAPLLISLFFLSLGAALFLSALNVYARDIQQLTELLVMLFMYLCPIIYSWTFVHDAINEKFGNLDFYNIYAFNPLSQIISGLQDIFWNGDRFFSGGDLAPDFMGTSILSLSIASAISILFALFAYKVFLKLEPNFAREL